MKIISSIILSVLFSLFTVCISAQSFDGYALYSDGGSYNAYLIDKNGAIAHTWACAEEANYATLLKDNGNIIRGAVNQNNTFSAPTVAGIIQELDPSGNVVWQFDYYANNSHTSHHDITLMPSGNVLLTAYEIKSTSELSAAGFTQGFFPSEKWPTHFVEVAQNGTGGQIVWEWHMWDHMIQDTDAGKPNFGIVANNPQLMDINVSTTAFGFSGDWFHVNGVDYNPTLDQIVFTSRYTNELYIIDHSTTTAEAASHTGGNAGMGGDFLYRWGNPSNYGSTSTQTIPEAVHDPRWVKAGRPNAGYIQFFNNEGQSNGNSAIDAINPPMSGSNYTSNGPTTYDWRHNCLTSATGQSSHDRMSNGNTFVNVSNQYMYEVDVSGTMIWQYSAGPYKAFRYECDHPGIIALLGNDPCGLATGVEKLSEANVMIFPNPSKGMFKISGFEGIDSYEINVFDMYGKQVLASYKGLTIDLSKFDNGIYVINITTESGETLVKKVSLIK
ncbi:MAG: hypothetical protein COB15_10700 [Flavobacteriales bacterium]|nr:MAG: hypothetical protein COB15_10700 [Flavobacteriales bacterium]